LTSIQTHIEKELAGNFPRGGSEGEVLETIKKVFLNGFPHLLTKCAQKIRETKSVILYQQDLHTYKNSDPMEINIKLNEAAQALQQTVAEYSKTNMNLFCDAF
jgi:hypothetical protein